MPNKRQRSLLLSSPLHSNSPLKGFGFSDILKSVRQFRVASDSEGSALWTLRQKLRAHPVWKPSISKYTYISTSLH